MLSKAAVMGDMSSFAAMCEAGTPYEVKKLGRGVSPWNEELWVGVVCRVGYEVRVEYALDAWLICIGHTCNM